MWLRLGELSINGLNFVFVKLILGVGNLFRRVGITNPAAIRGGITLRVALVSPDDWRVSLAITQHLASFAILIN